MNMSNDGFVSPDPTRPIRSRLVRACATGTHVDLGPSDQGSAFDVSLGTIGPGERAVITMYYDAATDATDAMTALYRSGSQVGGLAEPSTDPTGGTPYSSMIGFKR